jgi:hypothetical protein
MSGRVVALLFVAGCAFGAGGPFASVDATLEVALVVPAGRDAGDGWMKLDTNYQVRLVRATLELGEVELVAAGAAGAAFDPANPPPGYSLCHNGHCHAADGRLVSYEDIAAEQAGGAAATVALAFESPGSVDLLAGAASLPLDCGAPRCDLPAGTVALVRLDGHQIVLEGLVRDPLGRFSGEKPFSVQAEEALLTAPIDLPADRENDPDVTLTLRVQLGAELLDSFDFDGGGDLAAHLRDTLSAAPLTHEITR